MIELIAYAISLIMMVLGLRRPGWAVIGALLLTALAFFTEDEITPVTAISLFTIWVFALLLTALKMKG